MARGLSLYVEGTGPLHRAHPLTKGALTLAAIGLAFALPSAGWVLGLLAVLVLLAAIASVLRRLLGVALVVVLPLALLLLVVQGLVNPANQTEVVGIGPVALYGEGLGLAALSALRIACLVVATFLLSFTTRPADLAEALVQLGLSPRIGYVIQSALQIIPQTLEMATRIQDAQRARGLETEGSLPRRARAYLPLLLPLVLSSLVATQERAMALEVRGFGRRVRRISRHAFPDGAVQRVLRWALLLSVPAVVALRLAGWR